MNVAQFKRMSNQLIFGGMKGLFMKIGLTILAFLSITSTAFAECPKADNLNKSIKTLDLETEKLKNIADYLKSRLDEPQGAYQNSRDIALLFMEVRTESLRKTNQAARLQIQASKEVLDCYKK